MKIRLKPCPFCGSKDLALVVQGHYLTFEIDTYTGKETPIEESLDWLAHILCNGCYTEFHFDPCMTHESAQDCAKSAAEIWNNRNKNSKAIVSVDPEFKTPTA